MLKVAFDLFLLREHPIEHFAYTKRISWLIVTLIGVLAGLNPSLRAGGPGMPGMPLFVAIPFGILFIWMFFLVTVVVLKWWLKRGQRWDGQGDLFNLVAASLLVTNVLGAGLLALGIPPVLILTLWLYSIWVGGNAIAGAIPKADLVYAISGVLLSLILSLFIHVIVSGMAGFIMAALGMRLGNGLG